MFPGRFRQYPRCYLCTVRRLECEKGWEIGEDIQVWRVFAWNVVSGCCCRDGTTTRGC